MKNGKICIYINAYVANNLGDDMFIHTLCNHYPMITFYIAMPSNYKHSFRNINNLIFLSNDNSTYNNFLLEIIDFQVLIGGSLFMEPQLLSDIEKKFYKRVSYRLSPNIPFFVIGANFGDFTQEVFYRQYKKWFNSLDGICFRDSQSYLLFKDLPNVIWAPDLLFTYKIPNVKTTGKNIIISPIYNNGRTGLSSFDNNEYFIFLSCISQKYIEMGFSIILASFCSEQMDDIACQIIYSSIPDYYRTKVKILYYKYNINIFLKEFLNAKYIIGTRFHSIILALKGGVPVFPIIYNLKTKNALECYEFRGYYADINNLSSINFEYIDYNRNNKYAFDISIFEQQSHLHYYFLNEAIIKKLGEGEIFNNEE